MVSTVAASQGRVLVMSRWGRLAAPLCGRLVDAGYNVSVETSEAALVEHLSLQPPDAILCPVERADQEASLLLELLKDRESDACVIFVGPDLGTETVAGFLRNGAYDYVTTPVKPGRLEESLRQGLDVRRTFIEVRGLSKKLQATNAELEQERDNLRRWNGHLVSLNALTQTLSGLLHPDDIFRAVSDRLRRIVRYDLIGVRWWQPERIWIHADGPAAGAVAERMRATLLAYGSDVPVLSETPAVSHLEIPLMIAKISKGIIRLERTTGPFDPHEMELLVTTANSLALALQNAETHGELQNLAMRDGLTNLLNRRAFDHLLAHELEASERYRSPVCLLLADVDHFKAANDRFGHVAGDQLLKEMGTILKEPMRAADIVARYGGEEFAVILPCTTVESASILANRIRERVEGHVFVIDGSTVRLTLSLGIACIPDPGIRSVDQLVAAADAALYRAKAGGRNRVMVHEPAKDRAPRSVAVSQVPA